jgi:hypothetical protein
MMELAELGFIVVQIDGMGTSNRSKAFHDVCWKNLADAGLPDRILWMKAAAQKYPYMDVSRVGIYGTSAGGQSAAAAVMTHGDFYKAAVADSGCHDNRMDKIWWNEQWMGWPVGPEYAANSNLTLAAGLPCRTLSCNRSLFGLRCWCLFLCCFRLHTAFQILSDLCGNEALISFVEVIL